ncbi:MAG: hypothetical protein PHE29_09060, partial [Tissierellia bacterium]|nr:hypothetical protein [Tissierellia bacterium]
MTKFTKRILILGLALALNFNQSVYGDILKDIIEADNLKEDSIVINNETDSTKKLNNEENIVFKSKEVFLSDISGHWAESR